MIYGVDLSSWKPVHDWQAVVGDGNEFMITKATGGLAYQNELYREQIAGARASGMEVGHFHYLHETSYGKNSNDELISEERGRAEAAFFCAHVDLREGEVIALDVEDPNVTGDLNLVVEAWCRAVEVALHVAPLIYTYPYYIQERRLGGELTLWPLWYAEYNDPQQFSADPWHDWTIRQYTANAFVPGIGADVDRNIFRGTRAEFRALGLGQPTPAPTTPTHPDPETGYYVHEYFGRVWDLAAHGRPLAPAVLYSDGLIRQLFERCVLGSNGRGEPLVEGLGQAFRLVAPDRYPEWPTAKPLLG